MKRSEIIANVVKDLDGLYNANAVNSILFLLEGYGMLPPRVKVEEVRKATSPEGEEGTFVSWTYKSIWEPENGLQNLSLRNR